MGINKLILDEEGVPDVEKARETDSNKQDGCFICSDNSTLQEHHINGNRNDNTKSNTIMLCRGCHNEIHNGNKSEFDNWRNQLKWITTTIPIRRDIYERWNNTHSIKTNPKREGIQFLMQLASAKTEKYHSFNNDFCDNLKMKIAIEDNNKIGEYTVVEPEKIEVVLNNQSELKLIKVH